MIQTATRPGCRRLLKTVYYTFVRFLIKNYYSGKCSGGNTWIDLLTSDAANPVRNMMILPVKSDGGLDTPLSYQVFLQKFKDGLSRFHNLSFMDWHGMNNSRLVYLANRTAPTGMRRPLTGG